MKDYKHWLGLIVASKPYKSLTGLLRLKSIKETCGLFILGLWLLLAPITAISAQDLQVNLAVPAQGVDNFSVCGAAKPISLTIENLLTDTLTDVTISIPLLTGFSYVTGSLSGDATLLNATTPSFFIDTLFPSIQQNFAFEAIVNCNGITEINLGGNKNITADFTYMGGTGTFSQTSANFDLVKPTLAFTSSTPSSLNLTLNETATITSTLTNTSEGPLEELTFYIKKPTQLTLTSTTLNGNLLIPSSTSGDTSFYTISGGLIALANNGGNNGDANLFEENEVFTIIENYQLNDCTSSPTAFVRGANYGCAGATCEETTSSTPLLINSINITSQNDTTICYNDAIDLTATGGTDYLWRQLSGPGGTIMNPNLSTNATYNTGELTTDITYRVVVSGGNCADSLETTITVLEELIISNPVTICYNTATTLSITGGSSNRIWQQLDGPNGSVVTNNLGTGTNYNTGNLTTTTTFRLLDTDCNEGVEVTITVLGELMTPSDTTVCYNTAATLSITGGSSNRVWQQLDGPNGNVVTNNLGTGTSYNTGNLTTTTTYRLLDTDCNDAVEVTVTVLEDLIIANPVTICYNTATTLSITGGSANRVWQQLDGPNGNVVTNNLGTGTSYNTGNLTTTTTFQLLDTDCNEAVEVTITVLDELMISNDTTICIDEAIDLTVSGGSANYLWKEIAAPNGAIINANVSTNSTINTGVLTNTKFYRVVDVNCNDSLEVTVTVLAALTVSNDTIICPEDNVTLTATGGSSNFIWRRLTGPGGTILNDNISTTATFTTGMINGTRAFRVIDPVCMDSLEVTVDRFTPIPIFAGRDQTICEGMTINLVGQSGFSNYSWQALTGGPILSGQTVAISPTETTEYELIADDANGCEVRDTVKIIILEGSNFNVTINVPQSGVDKFSVCGPEKTITVTVENLITDTIANIDANFNLLPGFFYVAGSLVGDATVVDASTPTFFIDTIYPNQVITFMIDLGLNCDGIPTVNSAGDKNLSITFNCAGGGQNIFTQQSPNFEVAKATLTIPSTTPTNLEMYLNKIDTVTTRIVNGSQGVLDSLEFFIEDHANLDIVDVLVNGISIPIDRQAGGRTYFVLDGALIAEAVDVSGNNNDPTLLEFNEFFDIKEVYQMTSCNATPARLERGVNYGCEGEVCEESMRSSNVEYGAEQPSISFQPYEGFSTDMNPLCYNDGVIVSGFYFTNNGQAPATNIDFRLDDWAPHGGSPTTGFDQNSVTFQLGENDTPSTLTPASVGGNNCSGFPNNLRFNMGSLILVPGDTIFVRFDRYTGCGCNQSTGNGCQIRNVNSWRILGEDTNNPQYQDLCGFNTFNAGQFNFGGERVSLSTFLEAPIEINGGEGGTNIYNIPFYSNTIDEDCPTCYIEATYEIGNGLDVTGLMWIDDDGDMWTPDFFDYTDNGMSGGGGTTDFLTVRWEGTPPSGFSPSGGGSAILLKYVGDCDETGVMCSQGTVANIRQEIRYYMPPCTSCTPQFITCPIDNSVEIECPSCNPCNGLVHTVMDVQRASLGLGDNDDDGMPEAGEFIDTSMIRLDRVIRGDTIKAHYEGYVNGVDSFQFAFATLDMAISDYLPLGAELTIYDTDLDTTYICNIIQQFKDGNNLINNLSVANLISLGCADLPTDFFYAPGDSIKIDFFFRILEDVAAGVHNQNLAARFFVSDEDYGGAMFRCNDLVDNIYQIGLYETFFIQGTFSRGGCSEFRHDWEQRSWLGTSGDAGFDYFPNEYRESWRFPKLHTVTKPELDLISFQIFIRRKNGGTLYNQTVPANSPYVLVNGADYTLNVEQYVMDNGGIPFLDDGARFEIRTRLRGGCFTEVGTYDMPYEIEWNLDPNFFGQTSETITGTNTFTYTGGPQVSVQSDVSIVEISGENACFELTLSNTNNNIASNTFLQFQSITGAVIVTSLREVTEGSDSAFINPTTDIYELGDLNGNSQKKFELCVITNSCTVDSLTLNTGWSCEGYPATFQEAECVESDAVLVEPVSAEFGMTILQPSGKVTADLCTPTTYELEMSSGQLGSLNDIFLRFFLPQDVNFVAGSFELAYPIPLTGTPTFVAMDAPTNIFGNVYEINITEQNEILDSIGLVGTTDLLNNFLRVRFDTETQCGYTSGSSVRFLGYAFDACGELANFRFIPGEAVEIIGVTAPFISDVGAGDLIINPCLDEEVPININLTVGSGSDPISPNDSIRIMLPFGLEYVPNSYQNVQNSVTTPPVIQMENGEQIIYIDLVDGLSSGMTAEFTLDVKATIQGQQCFDAQMVIQTFSSAFVQCQSTGEFCTVRAASDEFSRNVTYIVPTLEVMDFTISSVVDGINETYTTSATVFNNSAISVPDGFTTTIEVYADIDDNGKFSPPDSLLGSIMTTDGIPALTSAVITGDFTIPANIYCNLLAVSNGEVNCSCPTDESFPVQAQTTFVFDKSHVVCSGETIQVGPTEIVDFTYEWLSVNGSNINAIQNVNAAQTDLSFVNVSGANLDWQFALRTIKDGDCYSFDTINVTIFPQRDEMIATQGCAGFPVSLSGPTDGSGYQWTPTTGLANANSPTTEVIFSGAATYNLTYTDPNGCMAFFEQTVTEGVCAEQTAIGDFVWLDANRDGIQDPSETGIPNLQVFLYNSNNLTTPIASTLTDFSGKYLFNPLPAGEYVIGFAQPGTNFTATTANNSANDEIDSDIDEMTLQTPPQLIANGDEILTLDAGFIEYECTVAVPSNIERICLGTSLQLSASIGGDVTTFQWEDANDLAANPSPASVTLSDVNSLNPVFTPTATGVYTFNFIGSNTNPNLCSDTATLSIIVEGEANPVIISDSTICAGGSTTLFAAGGTTYEWFENGIAVGNGTSLTINPMATSTYRLVATTDFGCTEDVEKTITVLEELTVTAGTDTEICQGEIATIAAQTGFESYNWVEIPSGNAFTGATIMVSPMATADYELTVVDSNGCMAMDTVTVTVNDLPIPTFTVNSSCGLNPISFSNNSTNAINYTWDFGDGATSTDNEPGHTYNAVGTYTVQLIANNANGCIDSISQQINVGTITASLSAKQEICPNESVTLVASGGTSYLWKEINNVGDILNDNLSTDATYQTGNLTVDGFYRVIIDNGTCIDSLETTVGIYPAETIDTGAESPICEGQIARLRADNGFTNYTWVSQTDGSTFIGQQVQVSPNITTTYNLTAIDRNGCTAAGRVEVVVNPTPEANFTVNGACNLNPVNFTNTSTIASGSIMNYSWNFGDGNTSMDQNPSHTYTNAGIYTVELTVTSNNNCIATYAQTIEIGTINTFITSGTTICAGDNLDLVAAGGTNYTWKELDGINGNITNSNLSNLPVYNTGNLTSTSFYRVIISNTTCVDSLETVVTIAPANTIDAGMDQTICSGTAAALVGEFGFSDYQWIGSPGGEILLGRIVFAEPMINTTYTLTAIDPNGCEVTDDLTVFVNSQPTPAFTSDSMCVLNDVNFTNTSTISSGFINTYAWDFGDGTGTSSDENPSYRYNAEGTYEVKLVVTSNFGCTDSITQNVFIDSISVSVTPNHAICPNEATTLVASGGESYVWKELDGAGGNIVDDNVSTLATFITDPLTATTVYRVIIETNNCIDSLETVITVWFPNTINAGADQTICKGESATLIAENNFTNYNWVSLPDGATYTGQTIIVTPTITSQFALTANDANGCTVRDTLQVTVNPNPIAAFTVMGSCGLNPINFTNTSTGGNTFRWDFGDGVGTSTDENPNYIYASTGIFDVKLVVTSADNCQDSITQQITVGNLPITISPDQDICPNESVTLVASGGTLYLWKELDGPNGNITNANAGNLPNYTTENLIQTTTFRVIVSDNNCIDSLETTVTINTPITINAGADQIICSGESTNLSAQTGFTNYQWQDINTGLIYYGKDIIAVDTLEITVNPLPNSAFTVAGECVLNPVIFTNTSTITNGSITNYAWDFGDGTTVSMDENPTHTYSSQGTYAVKLITTTDRGCQDNLIQNITIDSITPTLSPNQTICPNTSTILVATGGITYQWKLLDAPNGNILNDNLSNLSVYNTGALSTAATYRVIFDNNNCLDSLETTVTISTLANLNAGNDVNICGGETANLSAPIGFANYEWKDLTTGTIFIGQTVNVTPDVTTDYAIIADDGNGCTVVDTVAVIVNPQPIPSFTVVGTCGLNPITFTSTSTVPSGTITDWQWSFGDGNTSDGIPNTDHTYAVAGTYQVTLAVTTDLGCQDSITQEIIVGSLPITISADQSICPNETATLVASGGITYLWKILDAPNGNIVNTNAGSLANFTTSSLTATTTFRVVVSDNNCTDSLETTVTVNTPITINAGFDQNICEGETATLTAQTGFTNYEWTNLTNGSTFNGQIIEVSSTSTNDYALQANDINGCLTFDTVQIIVHPNPVAVFNTTGACTLNDVQFANLSTISNGTIDSYTWHFGDGMGTSTDENPTYNYANEGMYLVTLIIESDNGCRDSNSQEITIDNLPIAITEDQSICPNESVTLVAEGGDIYLWKILDENGNVLNANAGNLPLFTTNPLTDTTTFRVLISNNNCIDSLETTVNVFVPATLDAGTDQTICAGETANLSGQIGFTNYQWKNLTTGALFAGKDIVVNPEMTTQFALQANDINGCLVYDTLQINSDPQPIVAFTTSGDCVLNAVNFINNSSITTGNITTYNWTFGDGMGTSADENPSYPYTAAGTYLVKLVVISDQGCSDSLSQFIIVNGSNPIVTANQSICPNSTATLVATGAINYIWKELDGPNGTIVNNNLSNLSTYITTPLTTATTYRVIFDNGNCIDSLETTVSILTPATLNAGVDQTICVGDNANLSAQTGFANYQWQNLTTGEFFVGQDILVSPSDTTEFALQANDINGCLVYDTLQINVNPLPLANFTTTGTCVLNAVNFTNNSSIPAGNITNYNWDFGDGLGTSTDENPSYTYTTAGIYQVKLVAESDEGCLDSLTQSVTINAINPVLTANQSICPNESATLVASGATNYIWKELDNPNGNIVNNNLSTLSTYTTSALTTETTYRVIFDNGDCIDSLETTLSIFIPAVLNAGNDETICEGELQTLTAQNGFTNYNWTNLQNGATFMGQSIMVSPSITSQFALQANDANSCLVMDTLEVFVNPNPVADFTIMGSCGLNAIDFTNTSTIPSGIITTYNWDFGDGVGTSTDENPSYTYTNAGTYEVKLVITSDQNCRDSLLQTINVGNLPITVSADQNICPNESATLVASGGITYLWKELDGPNGSIINNNLGNQPTYITVPLTQTTTFRVIVSDNTCTDSLETTVTILTPASINAGTDITICAGETVNLNGETGFINYAWTTVPGGAAFFGPNIIVNPIQNTEYVLTANDVNGCMVTDTVAIFINETPIANINNENPILCPVGPNDLVLIALPQMGIAPYTYNWIGPNGFVSSDSIVTRMNPLADMSGIYTLQVTDGNDCISELASTEVIVRSTLEEPILSYSGPACEGTTMTLSTQTYAGEQVQFIWTKEGDTLNSISHQLVINPVSLADTGKYAVTVIVNECAAFSDTLEVEIYTRPVGAIATIAPQACVTGSEDLELIALPSGGVVPYTYAWNSNGLLLATDSIALILCKLQMLMVV